MADPSSNNLDMISTNIFSLLQLVGMFIVAATDNNNLDITGTTIILVTHPT